MISKKRGGYLWYRPQDIFYQISAAICLHGYRVQSTGGLSGSKRHAFELIPPDNSQGLKFFYFVAETETERKR